MAISSKASRSRFSPVGSVRSYPDFERRTKIGCHGALVVARAHGEEEEAEEERGWRRNFPTALNGPPSPSPLPDSCCIDSQMTLVWPLTRHTVSTYYERHVHSMVELRCGGALLEVCCVR